jgi:hypothetical protein
MEPVVAADAMLGDKDRGFTEMTFVGSINKIVKSTSMPNREFDFFPCLTILFYS